MRIRSNIQVAIVFAGPRASARRGSCQMRLQRPKLDGAGVELLAILWACIPVLCDKDRTCDRL
eukprot:8362396-Pyramimonas_sp.AAC.1